MRWQDVEKVVIELSPDQYNELYSLVNKARGERMRPAAKVLTSLEKNAVAWHGEEQRLAEDFGLDRYGVGKS
jgi:hypothetical protein